MALSDVELSHAIGVALNAVHAATALLASTLRAHHGTLCSTDTTAPASHASAHEHAAAAAHECDGDATATSAAQLARMCEEEAMAELRSNTPHYAIETPRDHVVRATTARTNMTTTTTATVAAPSPPSPTTSSATTSAAAAAADTTATPAAAAAAPAATVQRACTPPVHAREAAVSHAGSAAVVVVADTKPPHDAPHASEEAVSATHSASDAAAPTAADDAAHDAADAHDAAHDTAAADGAGQRRAPTWLLCAAADEVNVMHGVPECCVSLALRTADGAVVVGVVSVPCLNEVYCAAAGRGAFCNGERLHVSPTRALTHSVVFVPHRPASSRPMTASGDGDATGDGNHKRDRTRNDNDNDDDDDRNHSDDHKTSLLSLQAALARVPVHAIRATGSAAIEMCLVAAGRAEVCVCADAHACACAAAALIVREAGGVLDGVDAMLRRGSGKRGAVCCAGTPELLTCVLDMARASKFVL